MKVESKALANGSKYVEIPYMTYGEAKADAIKLINTKRYDYMSKYNSCPCFVKLPTWLANEFRKTMSVSSTNTNVNNSINNVLYGLHLCPTESIANIEDIEVF